MSSRLEYEDDVFMYFRPREARSFKGLLGTAMRDTLRLLWMRFDAPKRKEQRKHHISLCIMFKDEAVYLKEWLEYHLMVGVDHFYLYDNNSSDGFEDVVAPYIAEGLATLVRWTPDHAQVAGYEDCIKRFQSETDWIGFIDVDEFLVPVEEESLATFLDKFSHYPSVLVYWRFFGSGGMLSRDTSRLVIEDFTLASGKLLNKGKCFFNCDYDYAAGHPNNTSMFHVLWTASNGILLPPVDMFGYIGCSAWRPFQSRKKVPLQLNHYTCKSLEEFRERNKKGDVYFDHPTHNDDMFYKRDQRCTVPDHQIRRYIPELKRRLEERGKAGS